MPLSQDRALTLIATYSRLALAMRSDRREARLTEVLDRACEMGAKIEFGSFDAVAVTQPELGRRVALVLEGGERLLTLGRLFTEMEEQSRRAYHAPCAPWCDLMPGHDGECAHV